MSMQSDMLAVLAETLGAVQGETVVYKQTDDRGQTGNQTVVADAIVTPRGSAGYTDDDGRFYSRAIDVQIRLTALTIEPAEADTLTWSDQEWSIMQSTPEAAAYIIVAVRHERKTVAGKVNRRERRIPARSI